MTTSEILATVREMPDWAVPVLATGVVLALVALAILLRRWGRKNTASKVTGLATVLGLGFSAQGMYDTATTTYGQAVQVAAVLFVIFEAWLVGRMLRAHQYRHDRRRRARFVQAVWVGACVMAVVVAAGEGWSQAPGRLAIPLLVTYGWYTDLIADDDPDDRVDTERRWTWRELGLRIGWLKVRDADMADPTAAERRQLTQRMSRLAFALEFGSPRASVLLRRKIRLARMRLLADDDMIREMKANIARASGEEVHPVMPQQPAEPVVVPAPHPTPESEPSKAPEPSKTPESPVEPKPSARRAGHPTGTTVRIVDGRTLAGSMTEGGALADHFAERLLSTPGATTEKIRTSYSPAIGSRVADAWAAQARRGELPRKVNGRVPDLTSVP